MGREDLQTEKGGEIGLRATGTIAKVAMEDCLRRLYELLMAQGVEVHLLTKYVDDILRAVTCLRRGTLRGVGRLQHTEED